MKYDWFLFLNGFDVLKIRLAELSEHVDRFLLVESPYNFQGKPKPLYWKDNPISGYKVQHIVVEPRHPGPFQHRGDLSQDNLVGMAIDGILAGTKDLNSSDLIYLGDFDEIVRPSMMMEGLTDSSVGFMMDWYLYWLNCKVSVPIEGTGRMPIELARANPWGALTQRYASPRGGIVIPNAGWHFSSFGGPDLIMEKLAGFPAQEFDTLTKEGIEADIFAGRDIHNQALGQRKMGIGPLDPTLPKTVLENLDDFQTLIHPDYRNAIEKEKWMKLLEARKRTPREVDRQRHKARLSEDDHYRDLYG